MGISQQASLRPSLRELESDISFSICEDRHISLGQAKQKPDNIPNKTRVNMPYGCGMIVSG
jgi:hypothetical protein